MQEFGSEYMIAWTREGTLLLGQGDEDRLRMCDLMEGGTVVSISMSPPIFWNNIMEEIKGLREAAQRAKIALEECEV